MQTVEVTDELMAEIVRRIVDALDPEKIILFGSYARGNAGPDSDIDLLVIKSGVRNVREEGTRARAALRGILRAFDILVRTPEYVAKHAENPGYVIMEILETGKVIYDR